MNQSNFVKNSGHLIYEMKFVGGYIYGLYIFASDQFINNSVFDFLYKILKDIMLGNEAFMLDIWPLDM